MRVSATVERMIKIMLVAGLIIAAAGAAYLRSFDAAVLFGAGVFLTTVLNIVKTIWMERTVERVSTLVSFSDEAAGSRYFMVQQMLRQLLTGVVLILAALAPFEGMYLFWGAVFGIFTYHPAKHALWQLAKNSEATEQQRAG